MALQIGRPEVEARAKERRDAIRAVLAVVAIAVVFLAVLLHGNNQAVKYKWLDDHGKDQCEVRLTPKSTPRPCKDFTSEELNQFPLDWTNPYGTVQRVK